MKIETGYLYHLKDEFFEKYQGLGLMDNHNGSRPSYLVIKDKDILWFIPLSSKVAKYRKIIKKKIRKYGTCNTILIRKIAKHNAAILIQNAFPTLEKYVKNVHTIDGVTTKVTDSVKNDIIDALRNTLSLKQEGVNLFFTDIDKIEEMIKNEINVPV